ncbi:hypothetical protein GA0070606_5740 [Micromonospora citrea]|uniref:Uncharacterized protein n=1 Tax=Micromonospora citrea TaxID=47855 RepID=A0A1C6VYX1_9ACTN|nr:hypothetical protein [Micromonospora citrea]SCL71508.1 hypothetical protein GA0070606_5740 [Micromonospora citrea]
MVSVACHGGFAPDDGRAADAGAPAEVPEIDARHMSWQTGTGPDGGAAQRNPPPARASDTDPWWWGGPRDADADAGPAATDAGPGGPGLMP